MQHDESHLKARTCPMCGGASATAQYSIERNDVVACDDCGFIYLPVAASFDHLAGGDGAWENSHVAFTGKRLAQTPLQTRLSLATRFRTKFRKKSPVQFIERHFSDRPEARLSVLDIGCGDGAYLLSLGARFTPFGIEISERLAAQAQQNFAPRGGNVVNAPTVRALERFEPRSIDAIVMRSYLEHESDPLPVLKGCRDILSDRGIVVVKVPNYATLNRLVMGHSWCGFRFPDHVNYFTPASLANMAGRAGFATVQRLIDRLPTSDNMWAALKPA